MRGLDDLSSVGTAGLSDVKCQFTYCALARSSHFLSPSQQLRGCSRITSG